MKSQKKSKAFSLIELVFTIVVIGIIATAVPMLLQVTPNVSKSKQIDKILYAEFSLGNLIVTYYFDENNSKGTNYYKELNATDGDVALLLNYLNDDRPERIGKWILKNQCRDGTDYEQNVSHIGTDAGEDEVSKFDDVDDFNGYEVNLTDDNYPAEVEVFYVSDNANYNDENVTFNLTPTQTSGSNIKLIKITAYFPDKNGQKIVYYLPVFNIGGSKYLSDNELGESCE